MTRASQRFPALVGAADADPATPKPELGQVFTPAVLADFMVAWVLRSGRPGVFDPCFGAGAFLEAARRGGAAPIEGMEIDPEMFGPRNGNGDDPAPAALTRGDYLRSWGRRHANIVCNPPYLRFQRFPHRQEVIGEFSRNLDRRLSGYTNTAAAFLLKSLSELEPEGRLAYLMPLEFLNTGYGRVVKEQLLRSGRSTTFVSLDCEKEVFPEVTTSVGLVLCDAAGESGSVDFRTAGRISDLEAAMAGPPVSRLAPDALDPGDKWLLHFRPKRIRVRRDRTAPLRHYGRFRRGIATGANEFFVLRPSRAAALGLAPGETVPCIARSQQIARPIFGSEDLGALAARDAPVRLLGLDGSPSAAARAYLRSGEERGFHRRFLTRHRTPWYRTESRRPAPILFGVFARNGYKVVRNRTDAIHLTCYHGFQPSVFGAEFVDALFLYLSSVPGREVVALAARHYGDALDKFEPGDLTTVSAPNPEMLSRLTPEDRDGALAEVARTGRTPSWLDDFFDEIRAASTTRIAPVPRAPAAADTGRNGSFPGFPPPGAGDARRVRP